MKKVLGLTLCALMALGLGACSKKDSDTSTYNHFYSADIRTMDYVTSQYSTDHQQNANFVDGLLETNKYGKIVGALASEWKHNDDYTVWTFKLKEGVKWVKNDGTEYAEVVAQDFVTGLQHATEFQSGTLWLVQDVIKGLNDYIAGTTTDFSTVGVKALDNYTVEYTFVKPVPYFESMCTYAILYPVNQEFLESKGDGCKLGAPDQTTCTFGQVAPDSILYNGGFILEKDVAKSEIVLVKNEAYWDAENVHIDKVHLVYTDGSDNTLIREQFKEGKAELFAINASWANADEVKEEFAEYLTVPVENSSWFGMNFNYNRQDYDGSIHETDEDKANTKAAILNKNFRLAVQAAWNRSDYVAQTILPEVAGLNLRNINNYPSIVKMADGTIYGDVVTKEFQELTGTTKSLADGQDPFYSPEDAKAYIAAAKAEGVKFPVTLELPCLEQSASYVAQCQSLKASVEKATDGEIIIQLAMMSQDELYANSYYLTDPADAQYDISTFSGWSPDFLDPENGLGIYNNINGSYLVTTGLTPYGQNAENDAIADQVGWTEFNKMYFAASEIGTDLEARYAAFAKAEAYLIANALYVPSTMETARTYTVTRVVPFTRPYSSAGISDYKYKGMQLQDEPVTIEQYEAAKADFEANR